MTDNFLRNYCSKLIVITMLSVSLVFGGDKKFDLHNKLEDDKPSIYTQNLASQGISKEIIQKKEKILTKTYQKQKAEKLNSETDDYQSLEQKEKCNFTTKNSLKTEKIDKTTDDREKKLDQKHYYIEESSQELKKKNLRM